MRDRPGDRPTTAGGRGCGCELSRQDAERAAGGVQPALDLATYAGDPQRFERWQVLPPGGSVAPAFDASATLRFDHFEPLTALVELNYSIDPNAGTVIDNASGVAEPKRLTQQTVTLRLLEQARF